MKRKQIIIGAVVGITLILIAYLLIFPPSKKINEEKSVPPVERENQNNDDDQKSESSIFNERAIFLTENPKYELVDEQLMDFLQGSFPELEDKWNGYSYTIMSYLYGMITGNIDDVLPHITEPKESIQENIVQYKETDPEELGLILFPSTDVILIMLLNYYGAEYNERILAFDLTEEKITLDERMPSDQLNKSVNSYFKLPSMDELLIEEKYLILHDEITHKDIPLDQSVVTEVADSVIYYLHGMLTSDVNLVTSFTRTDPFHSQKGLDVEMGKYEGLDSSEINLIDIFVSEADPEIILIIQFKKGSHVEERTISVYKDLFINISTIGY